MILYKESLTSGKKDKNIHPLLISTGRVAEILQHKTMSQKITDSLSLKIHLQVQQQQQAGDDSKSDQVLNRR